MNVGSTRQVLAPDNVLDDGTHAPFDVCPDGTVVFLRKVRDGRLVVVRNFLADVARGHASGR